MRFDIEEVSRRLSARLKMRHLVLLLQIRQHGSLTRAAEHLASSQPAVTNALAELESMFGGPLFDRSPRGMVPTALGNVVLERAQAMLHDLDHLTRDIEAVVAGHAMRLHIGVIPFISGRTLAAAIRRTQSQVPQRLTMTIHEGTSDALMAQLSDHTLDIVIGRASSTVDLAQLRFEVLHQQKPRLIASRRLAARLARSRPNWRKLAELDWILGPPHTPIREQIADLFLHAGVAPPVPIVESYSSRLIGEVIVTNEDAVSIVPADIAEELVRIAGVAIVPYTLDWTLPPVAAFTRAGVAREIDTIFAQILRTLYQEADAGRAG
ncbi:LysR family transcriptional regulator [Burkholderia ubonensis]|uniref:LysR family transcriptional regulator n=1 Tax=Burkholderia ubonensis TaxID=101571 RepID=A0AAW3MZY3_9BURK|nr:LysR family transcriptional regulator [Burkholderia ubonensis]KVA73350.1 LysR family transcriptional regulator [Burkholderia ubonensis]KVC72196.1 LysR family transcriptional regulator [Burkholderia ubonensis]KVG23880.1 LysR family transcriptional regulator [Burkholderia ubonensis]KVH80256.1 LysR family transcriptional regulator [Burkholderia ubonensis]KVN68148.1 LysR family transcriptional regulator [Burkholderia ubonensis]